MRILPIKIVLAWLIVFRVVVLPASEKALPRAGLVPPQVLERRLMGAPKANSQREAILRRMFRSAGCGSLTEEVVSPNLPSNLVCTMRGESPSLIIADGHFDHVRNGQGIVDDWSGASMLPSLYQSLRSMPRKHTFLFIGFTAEEKGLVGSKFYVGHLSRGQLRRILAVVNLECLGMNPPEVWSDHAAPDLLAVLEHAGQATGIGVRGIDLERIGGDDAESFRHYQVPTITIHSLSQDTVRVLHSKRDNFSAIHLPYYYESYRLVARYLADLDTKLP